jgi:acyl carrier protein
MTLDEFIVAFAAEFNDTPAEMFKADTDYKALDEWNSLTALSVISMIDDEIGITITGADLRSCKSIEDLYSLVLAK